MIIVVADHLIIMLLDPDHTRIQWSKMGVVKGSLLYAKPTSLHVLIANDTGKAGLAM